MSGTVPYDRVTPQDVWRQLDWIRDEWGSDDEYEMTQKLDRLRRTFGRTPHRYYVKAEPLLTELGWCRVIAGRPWQSIIRALAEVARAWDHDRRTASG